MGAVKNDKKLKNLFHTLHEAPEAPWPPPRPGGTGGVLPPALNSPFPGCQRPP